MIIKIVVSCRPNVAYGSNVEYVAGKQGSQHRCFVVWTCVPEMCVLKS